MDLMKKHFLCLVGMIILLSATNVCYAGSVPEDLLSSDNAQVYFGEIKSIDGNSVTVIQRQNVKGEFIKDTEITYEEFEFIDSPEIGEQYLCGYYDENNPLYLWEVTSFDTKTLEIKNSGNSDSMAQRMQEYLNEGRFEEKEQERLSALKESEMSRPPVVETTQVIVSPADSIVSVDNSALVWILCISFIGIIAFILIRKRH